MKLWVEGVLTLCIKQGPQTAPQLAEFLAEHFGIHNTPSTVIYRLRRARDVTVEQAGEGRSATYLITRKIPAATSAGGA